MEGWQGRVDSDDDQEAYRWHQIVRGLVPNAPPGIALAGFACDEGIRRNGGRLGAADGTNGAGACAIQPAGSECRSPL